MKELEETLEQTLEIINNRILNKIEKIETMDERRIKRTKLHKLLKQERDMIATINNFWRKQNKKKITKYQEMINEMY